tara:strand:+ start:1716 stop:2948 length:1233 start_codon:yes stop_codon:yes gene_type:complete
MDEKIKKQNTNRADVSQIMAAVKATKLKYLKIDFNRQGQLKVKVRRHGKTVTLHNDPRTPEFFMEYGAALGELSSIAPIAIDFKRDTLAWLIDDYKRSGRFTALATNTKLVRARVLRQIADEFGEMKYAQMNRFDIEKIRAVKLSDGKPHAAEHRRKFLSQVFRHANVTGLIAHDPFVGIEKPADNPALRSRTHTSLDGTTYSGHWTWTADQVQSFFDYWPPGTAPHICMSLMFYLGVRISDAQKLGPRNEVDDRMVFTTQKRVGKQRQGVDMNLPITAPLRDAIEAAREANIVSLDNYVLTRFSKPFTQKSISHWFSERASMAGLPRECTAHGVRKALAKILADNGATSSELKATFGWTTSKLADLYTEQANKRDLATSGLERLGNVSVPLDAEKVSLPVTKSHKTGNR